MKETIFIIIVLFSFWACQREPDIVPSNPPRTDSLTPNPLDSNPPIANDSIKWQKLSPNIGSINNIIFLNPAKGFCASSKGLFRSLDSGFTWSKISPGNGGNVNDVYFVNPALGYYVGEGGTGQTINGGNTWTLIKMDSFFLPQHIFFTTSSTGYVTSKSGLFQTLDSSKTWQRSPKVRKTGSGLYFTDSLHGWVSSDSIWKTNDGGKTFSVINSNYSLGDFFYSIQFTDSLHGWVNNSSNTHIFRTINGGLSWEKIVIATPSYEIHFVNSNIGYIATGNGVAQSKDGGLTWKQTLNSNSDTHIYETFFLNEKTGWAADLSGNFYRTIP